MFKVSWRAVRPFPKQAQVKAAMQRAVKGYAEDLVFRFKADVKGGLLKLAPKQRGTGVPLVDTEKYITSWKATTKQGPSFTIGPTGNNARMSNEALGQLLEYGHGNMPARPHMRVLVLKLKRTGGREIGRRFLRELNKRA